MRQFWIVVAVLLAPLASAQQLERMSPELLWRLGRVSGGAISPDGEWAVYSVKTYDLAGNKGDADLFELDDQNFLVIKQEEPGEDQRASLEQAVRGCPTEAISIEE